AEFLPSSYESVQAANLAKSAFGSAGQASATVVLKRSAGGELTEADQAKVGEIAQRLKSAGIERVAGVVTGPQALSPNRQVQLINVGLQGIGDDPKLLDAVKQIRGVVKPAVEGTQLQYAVTGDTALNLDNQDAFTG